MGKTPGQPVGSTALAGFKDTILAGCNVSDGPTLESTLTAGYNVFMSSGRPKGTTLAAGYNIGLSNGRHKELNVSVWYTHVPRVHI